MKNEFLTGKSPFLSNFNNDLNKGDLKESKDSHAGAEIILGEPKKGKDFVDKSKQMVNEIAISRR